MEAEKALISSTQGRRQSRTPDLLTRLRSAGSALWSVVSPQTQLTQYGHDIRAVAGAGAGQLSSEHSEYLPGMSMEQHPDLDLAPDTPEQRRRCTIAYYNTSLVKGIVDSQVRQVIGSIQVQADTGSKILDMKIEDAWKLFLYDNNGHDQLKVMARHGFIDGGSLLNPIVNPVDDFEMQVVPYRLIGNPYDRVAQDTSMIRDGFKYDNKDRQIAYYIAEETGVFESRYRTGKYTEMPLFYHCSMPRLAGQTRGLSWYAGGISRLEMLSRWMDAMLQTAELHAYFVGLARGAGGTVKGMANTWSSDFAQGTSAEIQQSDRKLMDWARKHKFMLLPATGDVKLLQTQAPQLGDFIMWSLRFVARALGVSFERLTYDLSKTSFSSTKFGDRDDRMTVYEHQDLITRACVIINRRILFQLALQNGLITADRTQALTGIAQRVKFILPERPPIDEMKFEKANEIALRNQTTSRKQICASLGHEWSDVLLDQTEEARGLIATRRELYESFGVDKDDALKMAIEDFRGEKEPESTSQAIADENDLLQDDDQDQEGAA